MSGVNVFVQAKTVRQTKFCGSIYASVQTVSGVKHSSRTSYDPDASNKLIRIGGIQCSKRRGNFTMPDVTVSSQVESQ